jgi:hypothetical protein
MTEIGVVKRNIKRADRTAVDRLAQFGSATLHEAMGRVGLMKPYMRQIYPGAGRFRACDMQSRRPFSSGTVITRGANLYIFVALIASA